jgi:hypothetical protein
VTRAAPSGDRREAADIDRGTGRASSQSKGTPVGRTPSPERLVLALQTAVGNRATSQLLQAWRKGSRGADTSAPAQSRDVQRTGVATTAARVQPESVRRTADRGLTTSVIQAKGRLALEEKAPKLTTAEDLAVMNADSEEDVYLTRGVTPTQRKYLDTAIIRGSFISFEKMLAKPDEQAQSTVTRPAEAHADDYVGQRRTAEAAKLIEFSTKANIADLFAGEARYGYVFTIRIKRKYLTKGSSGSESGWIADQDAAFDIVRIERIDRMEKDASQKRVTLTEDQFREAVRKEQVAEYLVNLQMPDAVAAYLKQFAGEALAAERGKYKTYMQEVLEERRQERLVEQSQRLVTHS